MVDAPPATTESIRAQVEFYFSDSNLPADSYLMSKINDAKEDEGFIDLRTICTFTRMKEKLKVNRSGLITQEMVDKVAASLEDSATVAVRRDPDDKTKVMVKRITIRMATCGLGCDDSTMGSSQGAARISSMECADHR